LGKRPDRRTTGLGAKDIRDNSIWRPYASKHYSATAATSRRLNEKSRLHSSSERTNVN